MLLAEQAFALLRKYRIHTADYGIARNLEEAEFIAANMGFPLVLKIDSAKIVHKTDAGCVKLVYNADMLESSYREILGNAKKITGEINGVVVQSHIRGLEAIAGLALDQQFGKVIMFGSGGVLTQIFRDVAFRLVPISKEDAESMLDDTKISRLLNYRGNNIDRNAVTGALLKLNNLMQNEHLREMDINPLFLNEKGAFAADVRIIMA